MTDTAPSETPQTYTLMTNSKHPLTDAFVMREYGDRPGAPLTAAECLEFAHELEELLAVERHQRQEDEARYKADVEKYEAELAAAQAALQELSDATLAAARVFNAMGKGEGCDMTDWARASEDARRESEGKQKEGER